MYYENPSLLWDDVLGDFLKYGLGILRLVNRCNIIVAVVFCVVIAGVVLSIMFWEWLGAGESGSSTIRNVGLVGAGLIALPLALWRSIVADRQAKTSQASLLNERYQRGAEMLGNEVLSVRLGGIFALQRLAEERPEQYHVQIMRLFCAFARHPTQDHRLESEQIEFHPDNQLGLRQDLEAVILAIESRPKSRVGLENRENFTLDLRGTVLPGIHFLDADLSNAMLHQSELPRAIFDKTDLTQAILDFADLSEATFNWVIFRRTRLFFADLSGASFVNTDLALADFYNARLSNADLASANLSKANFQNAALQNANLADANLTGVGFLSADLSDARLMKSDLTGAHFLDANLKGAYLTDANLSGVEFSVGGPQTAKGLTQAQLDVACADPKNPPKLTSVVDSETGKPLVWRGKPVKSL